MCVGQEIFNLCKCGCTEADHEEELDVLSSINARSQPAWKRGKCHGRKLLPPDQAHVKPVFEDCACASFDPVFKNMCGGF
jgi:hypothetical protein